MNIDWEKISHKKLGPDASDSDYKHFLYDVHDVMEENKFTFLGKGRHRTTYLSPNRRYVLKFPNNYSGHKTSKREALIWSKFKNKPVKYDLCVAPCRMYRDTALVMKAVIHLFGETIECKNAQAVIGYHNEFKNPFLADVIDSNQVGILPGGKLVAYDFGSDF